LVRHTHIGEGGYENADLVVTKLLAEKTEKPGKAGNTETTATVGNGRQGVRV
jgi:hypothetical protein